MKDLQTSPFNKGLSPSKIIGLSPQKYGKAAYENLTYTPGKLFDNVLYRQVLTLKKHQNSSNKLREFEAITGFMQQKMQQLQLQRDGIQKTLSQQVSMYKMMVRDAQIKHQQRLKQIQRRFAHQISILIEQKQEEAKFSQAQKQQLENKVAELEELLKQAQARQNDHNQNHQFLQTQHQKLHEMCNNLSQNLRRTALQKEMQSEQFVKKYDQIQKKLVSTQVIYRQRLQTASKQQKKQAQNFERILRTESQKAETLRTNENIRKSQELRDIMTSFENETKRINQVVAMKDRMIQNLTKQSTGIKENLFDISKNFQDKIRALQIQRQQLIAQNHSCVQNIENLTNQMRLQINARKYEQDEYGTCSNKLREELQINQVQFIRQKDKFEHWVGDLQKQLMILKQENVVLQGELRQNQVRLQEYSRQSQQRNKQMRNMQNLLIQSSYEIEQSKQQLIKISYQKEHYYRKMQNIAEENQKLYCIQQQLQQQAIKLRTTITAPRRTPFHDYF